MSGLKNNRDEEYIDNRDWTKLGGAGRFWGVGYVRKKKGTGPYGGQTVFRRASYGQCHPH